MHPKRSTDLFNTAQATQIPHQQRIKNSVTNPTQRKQRKQLVSNDSKNILLNVFNQYNPCNLLYD